MTRSRTVGSLHSKPGAFPEADSENPFRVTSNSLEKKDGNEDEGIVGRFKRQCTWDGPEHRREMSPSLSWHNVPEGTVTFALTMVDIDAPDPEEPIAPFTHWVVINIPAEITSLPEGYSGQTAGHGKTKSSKDPEALNECQEGVNDFKLPHYSGPNPPTGTHRYVITLYALDTALSLGNKPTKEKLEDALEDHVVAQTELIASYTKEKGNRGIEQAIRDHRIKEGSLWKGGQ